MSDELIIAVTSGDIKKVVELLSSGADVNVSDTYNRTPLHFAALNGDAELASLLLKHGANVNAQHDTGLTPLHYAAWYGYTEVAKLLLDLDKYFSLRILNSTVVSPKIALSKRDV
jgi:ankyrin repeat protein